MIATEIETEDYLNTRHSRNSDNTDTHDYNCGGYALNTYSCYMPYEDTEEVESDIAYMVEEGYSREEIYENLLVDHINYMLADFPNLTVLSSPTDIKENQRLIYYRIGYELVGEDENGYYDYVHFDFHYRYFEQGHWHEKQGLNKLRECDKEIEQNDWSQTPNGLIYDSRTIYLALEI